MTQPTVAESVIRNARNNAYEQMPAYRSGWQGRNGKKTPVVASLYQLQLLDASGSILSDEMLCVFEHYQLAQRPSRWSQDSSTSRK